MNWRRLNRAAGGKTSDCPNGHAYNPTPSECQEVIELLQECTGTRCRRLRRAVYGSLGCVLPAAVAAPASVCLTAVPVECANADIEGPCNLSPALPLGAQASNTVKVHHGLGPPPLHSPRSCCRNATRHSPPSRLTRADGSARVGALFPVRPTSPRFPN